MTSPSPAASSSSAPRHATYTGDAAALPRLHSEADGGTFVAASLATTQEPPPSDESSAAMSAERPTASKKRRAQGAQDEMDAASTKRKPWSTLKKEEKELLLKEAKYLEAQIDFLQHLPQNTTAARILERTRRENKILQDAARAQQCDLAGVQSALTSYTMTQRSPFERFIHLGRDPRERRETLLKLKDQTLCDAEQYLRERSRFLDVTQRCSSMDKFTTPNGDFMIQVFEMMPLQGVTSIKQVFDALRFFYFNMDISLMESSGELVMREAKYELPEQNVTNQRFIRSATCGVQVESNAVMIGSYSARDEENGFGREYAIITMDFVNEDELYSYKPEQRLRQDLAAAITLRTFPRKVLAAGDDGQEGDQEFNIVMCRSYFSKLHHSELMVPAEIFDSAVIAAEMCSKEVLRTVYDVVQSLEQSV